MASTLISMTAVREHVESGLPDDALERLVDAADADIVRCAGTHSSAQVRVYERPVAGLRIALPAGATVTRVRTAPTRGGDWVTLAPTEYSVGGSSLYRTGAYWTGRVEVSFSVDRRTPLRVRALVDLVRLYERQTGMESENLGGYTYASPDFCKMRDSILKPLRPPLGVAI